MKVKGLSGKISNINSYHLPCSSEEYDELRNGNEVDIEDDRAGVLVRETTFYSGGIFSDGYDSSTFRMTLRLDNEVWKIRSASQYWSNCLSDSSAC